ncbi:MAG TPA: HmuY family protein [Hyalangium sp.]|nr:HmuY family protein [Hyalangium sp.]
MRILPIPPALPRHLLPGLLLTGCLAACGPDLQPEPGPPGGAGPGEVPAGVPLSHQDKGDGTFVTTVDASSSEKWIGLDLDHRQEANAAEDKLWDIAFQRFHIRVRGGASGTGNVAVAVLPDVNLAQVSQAPAERYTTDAADGDDSNSELDTAFETAAEGWYSYNVGTHKLSPRERVYVIRTDEGAFFKVQILEYYDSAGTPAILQVHWGSVQPPSPRE